MQILFFNEGFIFIDLSLLDLMMILISNIEQGRMNVSGKEIN